MLSSAVFASREFSSNHKAREFYATLGKIFELKQPEQAREMIETYLPTSIAAEEDLLKIPEFFKSFCALQNKRPEELSGPLYKSEKVELIRIFISSMIHLYSPDTFTIPTDALAINKKGVIAKRGIVRAISVAINRKDPKVSEMIREVILWEKQYEEFAESVLLTIEKLTHGCAEK